MKSQTFAEPDVGALMREVRRYLATVDTFRAEGREPHWLPEPSLSERRRTGRRKLVLDAPPIP